MTSSINHQEPTMPISPRTTQPQAIDAYLQHLATIRSQLEALQRHADDHFGHDPEHIHWCHVGDLTRIEHGLREVLVLLDGSNA
ncbi:MAG: hypothetical protein B7X93_05790 [Hydrogenophilales bacterium 17-61-9]|nr:MAG: hypothetical protein B7X93_05790 [Hydrogenophilales bacterium 17-61-9]